ncbi:unnamed protein product [Angiostrongylus costaricensis]|uniref:NR LBD domain-containing protein n=1 Tax=Angiostrongylus costaricensis TaxID=334426 RepID=A0A158PEE8_ANGCS|nr:unnamed protein product [Angiostrongylus costaricensis]
MHACDGIFSFMRIVFNESTGKLQATPVYTQSTHSELSKLYIAAAVAQHVAAHIVNATPVPAPVAAPMPPALNQPTILTPAPASSLLLTPSLNPIPPMTDMVTIPREVLVKLIENNPPRVNCTCQCSCGRYPPGCAIVDEVTKDLLAAGNNAANTESKEELKLDSAEDFHMNGLLPSDESSVQWLNSYAPTVDPSAVVDEKPSSRRDSFYTNSGMVESRINSVPASTNLNGLTPSDYVCVNEILGANFAYRTADMMDQCRHDDLSLQVMSFTDDNVRRFVRMLKRLPSFNLFTLHDQCILIRHSCVPYAILHDGISYTSSDPRFIGHTLDVRLSDLLHHCVRFYLSFKEELRNNENVMLILGLLVVFDLEDVGLQDRDGLTRQYSFFSSLLQRNSAEILGLSKCSQDFRGIQFWDDFGEDLYIQHTPGCVWHGGLLNVKTLDMELSLRIRCRSLYVVCDTSSRILEAYAI